MMKLFQRMTAAFVTAALIFGFALAQTQALALEQKVSDGVKYITGGFGLDEREEMASMAKSYNLKLEFAMTSGQYTSEAMVTIRDSKGKTVFQTESDGPWLFAELPHGQYTAAATLDNKKEVKKFSVGKGMKTVIFDWK